MNVETNAKVAVACAKFMALEAVRERKSELTKEHVLLNEETAAYKEQHPDRRILVVDGKCVVDDATLHEQGRIAMSYGFPEVARPQDPPYSTPLLVVGAGLSAIPLLEEIREKAKTLPVVALKGAHNWLLENGIVPTFACALDPQQSRAKCFKNPRKEVIYLCASTMHPDTWEHLKGQRVILFHQLFNKEQKDAPQWLGKTLLGGGSTTGLRAIVMMFYWGFRDFQLYGFDSCVRSDGIYKMEDAKVKGDEVYPVFVGDREFYTTSSLYAQVQDMRGTFSGLPSAKVTAHGDGLFQEVLRAGQAAGWSI